MSQAFEENGTRERIVSRLRARPEVSFALLFGSRVAGRPVRPDSDWDVAVFLDPELDPKERFDVRLRLIADLEEVASVDLAVLNDASPLLGHRALQGELLFARDRVAYVRYFVLRDLRRLQRVDRQEFRRDRNVQAKAERWLQLAGESTIDLEELDQLEAFARAITAALD